LVFSVLDASLQLRQSFGALFGIAPTSAAIGFLWAFARGDLGDRPLQVFHLPYLVMQTVPFASFDSSFEGCQHALSPHRCFGPSPAGRDFSALFSLGHSRQLNLQLCFLHASTFLPSFAPRSLPASSLL